ncbi:hypothetical protein AGMMS49545_15700 [Betaproteobacteria bacterium]|nr:hypothetical protein AGMMS49545_15700 [Betaproteobacteria bacterium]GHU45228.1 hypothetical protein AGMMS50289_15880 [Betaproteobacteria bacterium]
MRAFNFLGAVAGILGTTLTVALAVAAWASGEYAPQVVIAALGTVNIALAIICLLMFLRSEELSRDKLKLEPLVDAQGREITQFERAIKKIESDYCEAASALHSILDQLRDKMYDLGGVVEAIDRGDSVLDPVLRDHVRTNEMFYLFVVDIVKTSMDILTGGKCSVCIKFVFENEREILMLRTFMRDSNSYRERKIADLMATVYPYYDNTAFKEILDGKRNYYASDDLSSEKPYFNSNQNWREQYNSTLVCPIRILGLPENDNDGVYYSVLGFICVDNREGGLAKQICVQTLASVADSLYNHFLAYHKLTDLAWDVMDDGLSSAHPPEGHESASTDVSR